MNKREEDDLVLAAIAARSNYLSIQEAAAYIGTTRGYVQALCRKRQIPFAVMGKKYVLTRADCDAHVRSKIRRHSAGPRIKVFIDAEPFGLTPEGVQKAWFSLPSPP